MSNIITVTVVVILVSFFMKKLALSSKKLPEMDAGGKKILRYPMIYEIISWFGLGGGILLILGLIFTSNAGQDPFGVGVLFGLSIVVFLLLIFLRRNVMVTYDEEKMEYRSIFRKKIVIQWKDVKSIKFFLGQLVMRNENKKVIAHYSMTGFQDFLENVKAKIDPLILGNSLEKTDKFLKRQGFEWKKFVSFFVVIFIFAFLFGMYSGQKRNTISNEDYINQEIKGLKSKIILPQKMDEVTTLVDVTPEKDAVRYHYTISSNVNATNIAVADLKNVLVSNVCKQQILMNLLNRNINMEYSYVLDATGEELFVVVNKADCIK